MSRDQTTEQSKSPLPKRDYWVWDSYHRELHSIEATSPRAAADAFSLKERTGAGYVIRAVANDDVSAYSVGVYSS